MKHLIETLEKSYYVKCLFTYIQCKLMTCSPAIPSAVSPRGGHVCPAGAGEEPPRSVNISPPTHFTIQQILEMGEALILFRLRCAASRSRV